jgi:hypothetical protein
MAQYFTTLTEQEFADAVSALGFDYVSTTDFATRYRAGVDVIELSAPEAEVYEKLEVATTFKLTPADMDALHITASK